MTMENVPIESCERILGQSCYWYGTSRMREEDAQLFCGERGGRIVEIESGAENTLVAEMRIGKYKLTK